MSTSVATAEDVEAKLRTKLEATDVVCPPSLCGHFDMNRYPSALEPLIHHSPLTLQVVIDTSGG